MDLTKLSVVELKAMAWDCFSIVEQNQQNIRIINAEIVKRTPAVPEVTAN